MALCDRIADRDERTQFEIGLLRARVLLRLSRADKAVEALRACSYAPTSPDGLFTAEMLLGTAYVRLGQHARGEELLASAHARCEHAHPTIRAELTLNLGIARHLLGRAAEADALLAAVPEDADIIHARALEYRGWTAFARGRFDLAAGWFRSALTRIEGCRWHDRFVEACVLQGLVAVNAELLETEGWEAAERRIAAFDWSAEGVGRSRFWIAVGASSIRETLGDEHGALDWSRRAEEYAPSAVYRAIALCRTSAIFFGLGERRGNLEFALRAKAAYETVDPRKLEADQRHVAVSIAEELARAHAFDEAERLMTHFRDIVAPALGPVGDDLRYAAFRDSVAGAICEARGDRNGAVRAFTQALAHSVATRQRRRAAAVALRLAQLTGAPRYVRYATLALREADRRFWMARDADGMQGDTSPMLTENQRTILTMVAQGKTYKEIGAELHRSWKTVNNTVEQLRGKFGAGSRGELVAEAVRRGVIELGRSRTA